MVEQRINFDDGAVYERFMGRWSRAIGSIFLDWLSRPKGARWLDVGCGTGVFTELIDARCAPSSVVAVDPAPAQIAYVSKQPLAGRAEFRVADAEALPFADQSFDVVASALVINFIPDRAKALAEMRRVARADGMVAGYVWDFAAGRASGWPVARGFRALDIELPKIPGMEDSSIDALSSLFGRAGFRDIETRVIDVSVGYRDFDDFWLAQTPHFTPNGKIVAALSETDRAKLKDAVRAELPIGTDGGITYSARANAVKALIPG